jgi:L-alanine-DL-glutamate epimerase-like enolase superfamily enzyme
MIRIHAVRKTLFPKHVFRIARGNRPRAENIFLVAEQDGRIGYGEASPSAYFNEDFWDVHMRLSGLADYFRRQTLRTSGDISRIWEEVWPLVAPSRATQCALDVALWDLFGKLTGRSAADLAWGAAPRSVATSATLGICPPEEWPERIAEAAEFPVIKVKVGADESLDLLRAVRAGSRAAIRVDANCAWSGLDIGPLSRRLADLGVEFLEQPLPREEDARMPDVLRDSCLPILADESCATLDDVEGLRGRFSGFNIKLVKCGGITPGLRMLESARRLGLRTMVGCMLESSLLIAAGWVVAQRADYADLDGAWLLRNDPFRGLPLEQGLLLPPAGPGLGVLPADEYT